MIYFPSGSARGVWWHVLQEATYDKDKGQWKAVQTERVSLEDPARSSEPQLSTCSFTVFANWVFSAKQDTMLSVILSLFSQNMKINPLMTKGQSKQHPYGVGCFGPWRSPDGV